jgi:hypothetical protein
MKSRLIFSGIFAFGAFIGDWLMLGDSSPFHNYFVWQGDLPHLWIVLNILPVIGSAIAAGNPHSGSEIIYAILLVIQWFIIGFLLSGLARYFRRSLKL